VPGTVTIDGRAAAARRVPSSCRPAATPSSSTRSATSTPPPTSRSRPRPAAEARAAKLVPAWAEVSIASEPAGAEVRVGGELRGRTPLALESWPVRTESSCGSRLQALGERPAGGRRTSPLRWVPCGRRTERPARVRSSPAGAETSRSAARIAPHAPRDRRCAGRAARRRKCCARATSRAPRARTVARRAGGAEFTLEPTSRGDGARQSRRMRNLYWTAAPRGAAGQTWSCRRRRTSSSCAAGLRDSPRHGDAAPAAAEPRGHAARASGREPAEAQAAAAPAGPRRWRGRCCGPAVAAPGRGGALAADDPSKAGQELRRCRPASSPWGSPRREAGRRGERGAAQRPAERPLLPRRSTR